MQNYVVIIESVFIGFALLSAINHFIHASYLANRKLYILFALMALIAAAHESSTLTSYFSYSIPDMINAQYWRTTTGFLFFLVFPWFLALYTGFKPVKFIVALSTGCIILLTANTLLPAGIALSEFKSLFYIELPWGETVMRAAGPMSPWLLFGYVLIYTEIGLAYYAGTKQYRSGDRTPAIALISSISIFTILLSINYLISIQVISFMYTVGFGFLALVLAMSFHLSGRTREASEKVADYEHQLHSVLDHSDAVVYVKDAKGKYRMVNRRFEKVCQVKQEDLQGKTDADIFPEAIATRFMENDAYVLKTGEGMEFEERLKQPDGDHIYHSIKMPIKDNEGAVFGLFGISTDITARKHMENEIRERRDDLEEYIERRTAELTQANTELEAFCSAVSHDLRSPLNAIFGYSQMLLRSYGETLDNQGQKFLKTIESSSKEMNELITALLQLSRVSREDIKLKTVDLTKLSWKAISDLEISNTRRVVNIDIQDGLSIDGDENLLQIAITNLISNAWKYSGNTKNSRIEVGSFLKNRQRVFYVKDNGAGFDMNDVDNLFVPFKRLHADDHFSGSGIGLSTVQRIISRHKGKVWAESRPEMGATFFFTLWSNVSDYEKKVRPLHRPSTPLASDIH